MSKPNIAEFTDWFYSGKYGVMMHFLGSYHSTDEEWNSRVNAFDCEKLAKQLHECGASHLIFTICQCGGRFCLPVPRYDKRIREAGIEKHLCSDRDLIEDLYQALEPYGINLMLYAPAYGVAEGEFAEMLKWHYTEDWFPILRDISLRYGTKVKGWWIDGCEYSLFADKKYDEAFESTLRAGNPNTIIAYNTGAGTVAKMSERQDYTAGEVNYLSFYPVERFIDGLQWHVLAYLGPWWTDAHCVFSNEKAASYVKECTDKGGVVSFDFAYNDDCSITDAHFEQLMAIKAHVRDGVPLSELPESADYKLAEQSMASFPLDMIPSDYVNIAQGKKASASSYYAFDNKVYGFEQDLSGLDLNMFHPQNAVDGDIETGWAPGLNNPHGIWWQLDLGKTERIDAFEYITRRVNNIERRLFAILVSDDPEFGSYETLYEHGYYPMPLEKNWSKLLDKPVYGRYIRVVPKPGFASLFISELRLYNKQ